MFVQNQIIRAKRSQLLAKVRFIDSKKNSIQIEYLNPQSPNYFGLFDYSLSDFSQHWDVVDNPDNKVISLSPQKSNKQSNLCNHDWVHYQGFIDSYFYCSKCDEKRK